MRIADLQRRLTLEGYPLSIDNQYGAKTQAAILSALTDPVDTPLAVADVQALAMEWKVSAASIWAVREVEASGAAFTNGRPTILFEPHRFSKATGGKFDRVAPTVSYPKWDASKYPRTQDARYAQLLTAVGLDPDAGFASASYGAFQIMGENYAACGELHPLGFALNEATGEAPQLRHFAKFCESKGLVAALRRSDWASFARGYNGTAYAANHYDVKLAAAAARNRTARV